MFRNVDTKNYPKQKLVRMFWFFCRRISVRHSDEMQIHSRASSLPLTEKKSTTPLKLPPTLILNTKTRWELNVAWRPRLNLQPMNGESESKRESGVIPGRVSGGGFSGCCLFSSVVEAASSRKVKKRGVRLLAYLEPTHPAPKFPTLRLIRHYSAFFSSKG